MLLLFLLFVEEETVGVLLAHSSASLLFHHREPCSAGLRGPRCGKTENILLSTLGLAIPGPFSIRKREVSVCHLFTPPWGDDRGFISSVFVSMEKCDVRGLTGKNIHLRGGDDT
ncbi:hypothetical protein PBY51_014512 [Eleginops maclovinus]|uniref:Secreted protein n=1 Tax=Eleginops maclovinus TaxID=56733 RepID=A0AAN7WMC8_ELEMC|nr:hypothetical protein PBY51_014512 [Eleginops maclovinus]